MADVKIIITQGTVCGGKVVRPNKKGSPISVSEREATFLVNTGKAVFPPKKEAESGDGPSVENREDEIQVSKRGKK